MEWSIGDDCLIEEKTLDLKVWTALWTRNISPPIRLFRCFVAPLFSRCLAFHLLSSRCFVAPLLSSRCFVAPLVSFRCFVARLLSSRCSDFQCFPTHLLLTVDGHLTKAPLGSIGHWLQSGQVSTARWTWRSSWARWTWHSSWGWLRFWGSKATPASWSSCKFNSHVYNLWLVKDLEPSSADHYFKHLNHFKI